MLPPLCAWILANGQPCNQFALRRQTFCRAHHRLARIDESNQELRETLDLIATIDAHNLISLLQHVLDRVLRHTIAPARAQTLFEAAQNRLTALLDLPDDDLDNDPAFDDEDDDAPLPTPHAFASPAAPRLQATSYPLPAPVPGSSDAAIAHLNALVADTLRQPTAKTATSRVPSATSTLTPAR
jgi:hypothetical protein